MSIQDRQIALGDISICFYGIFVFQGMVNWVYVGEDMFVNIRATETLSMFRKCLKSFNRHFN